jgi:hypothetical protein
MGVRQSLDLEAFKSKDSLSGEDVLSLRRAFFDDGVIKPDEAEALFDLNRKAPAHGHEWNTLFVEALTDFVVNQALPHGYVTSDNAQWLIDRITVDGAVERASELELVVKIIETASYVPEALVLFAIEQVRRSVVEGRAIAHPDFPRDAGVVSADEVELIRRILFAFGGEGNIAVSRAEAELLFDINDATDESRNDPAWSDLFVKAIANHLMAASGYQVPTREEALRREEWLEERDELSFGSVLGKMLQQGLAGALSSYREQDWEEAALERLERQHRAIVTAEEVTETEASWLNERIGRDGQLRLNERALIGFLRAESPKLHPSLQPLLGKAA